jgi:Ca-activated chloride channel family protein
MHPFFLTLLDDPLSFGAQEWLWALLLLLPILGFFIQAGRKRSELLSKILAPRLQEQLAGRVSPLKRNLRLGLLLLSLALIIISLAQPRYGADQQTIKSSGRDVIIAIDTSRSMLSTDTAPSRLGRAKLISQDLLNLLKGDRVGVIAFAGTAFLQAPLTLDKGAVLTSIDDLDTQTIPKGGTDIAAAIQMAIAAFGKGEGTSRALVIMTDGEELEASGVEAAKEAAALGIKIFTIGFGSAEGSLIPIKTESGQNDFVRDENGNPVNSKLDAARLTEIAKATGGFYQPYGQDAAKIIYDQGIVPIEAKESGTLTARKPIERYGWPATAALILLSLWSVLGEGRGRRAGMIVAAGLMLSPLSPTTLMASGLSDYNQGNYQGALKDFEKRIQSGAASPEVRFDAGAAAYKAGDYKKAAEYFSDAMTSSSPKIRDAATYNLANSLVRTGEAAKENEAKLSDWKNSLQHYDTVLKAAPNNSSAKENREIVKKLIEDLKKQQEQKKQQDKKNDQKKDQKDKDKQKQDQSQGGGKSDQKKDQDQKKEDSKNQDQKDQQKNDPSQKDSQNSQGSGGKDQQNQDQKNSGQQPSPTPQQGKEDQKGGASPTPTPSPSPDQGQGSGSQKQDQQGSQKQDASQQPTPSDGQKNQDPQKAQGGQPSPTPAPSPEDKKEGKIDGGEQGAKPEEKSEEQKAAEAAAAGDESKDGKMSPNQARALLRSVQDEEQHVLNQQQRSVDQTLHDW